MFGKLLKNLPQLLEKPESSQPMESSPSAIGGLDPVLENCDVAVPHPKDAMIMNLGWNTS